MERFSLTDRHVLYSIHSGTLMYDLKRNQFQIVVDEMSLPPEPPRPTTTECAQPNSASDIDSETEANSAQRLDPPRQHPRLCVNRLLQTFKGVTQRPPLVAETAAAPSTVARSSLAGCIQRVSFDCYRSYDFVGYVVLALGVFRAESDL